MAKGGVLMAGDGGEITRCDRGCAGAAEGGQEGSEDARLHFVAAEVEMKFLVEATSGRTAPTARHENREYAGSTA